jgi:hypothetical protein
MTVCCCSITGGGIYGAVEKEGLAKAACTRSAAVAVMVSGVLPEEEPEVSEQIVFALEAGLCYCCCMLVYVPAQLGITR